MTQDGAGATVRGMDVDQYGRTALHEAALKGDARQMRALLDGGLDPNVGDRRGFTALHFAAQQGSIEAALLLLDAGADVDPVDSYGNTPLWVAVFNSRGNGDLIELLRAHGADPHHANNAGRSPAALAHLICNFDVAQFFGDVEEP